MTRDYVEALEERVAEFAELAQTMLVIAASNAIDGDAETALNLLHRHTAYLTDKLDELTKPARAQLVATGQARA